MFEKSQDFRLKVWLNKTEWQALQAMAIDQGLSVSQTVREFIHRNAAKTATK